MSAGTRLAFLVALALLNVTLFGVRATLADPAPAGEQPSRATFHPFRDITESASRAWASLPEPLRSLRVHGRLWQETAYRVNRPRRFTKIRENLMISGTLRLSDALTFHSSHWLRYDAVHALTRTYSRQVRSDEQFEYLPRETYLDYSHGPFDVRLGRQQIVWGDAVGLFFADVVNAKDLREYILPDFDLIRRPQWAVNLEATRSDGHAQLIWLPVRAFHLLGVSGSEFAFPLPLPPNAAVAGLSDPSEPPANIASSEIGGRLSYLWRGLDTSVFYLYTWDKFPVLFRKIESGFFHFQPEYRRAHLFGGSFSKAVGDVVLKGELVANPHAYLPIDDATDPNGVVNRTTVDYLVGADYTFFGKLETNLQLLQRAVGDYTDHLINEKSLRTHVSLRLKMDLLDGKLQPELLTIAGLSESDLLLRPKVTYKLGRQWQARVGADVFQGEPSGLFGRFTHRSRLWADLTLYF